MSFYLFFDDTLEFIDNSVVSTFFKNEPELVSPKELTYDSVRSTSSQISAKVGSSVKAYNYKAYVFDKYFETNSSPLSGYGNNFVRACERHGATSDCLLMVAIAKAETDLCKTGISDRQKNCWGFGGSGENRIEWPTYPIAIDEVTRRVMIGYGTRFFEDANNGALYYCGRHCNKWGDIINSYKYQINEYGKDLGFPSMI
ncbi:MAG TPA: hypothetical protein ENI23_09970 [bacterium]|nr:hypothetical protein [bacterium]